MQSHDTFEGPGSTLEALARGIAALVSSPAPTSLKGEGGLKASGRKSWLALVRDRAGQKLSNRKGSL